MKQLVDPPGLSGLRPLNWRRLLPVKRQSTSANEFTVDTRWPCRSALISLSCFFDTLNKWLCYWNEPPCLEGRKKKDVECSLVECADRKGVTDMYNRIGPAVDCAQGLSWMFFDKILYQSLQHNTLKVLRSITASLISHFCTLSFDLNNL